MKVHPKQSKLANYAVSTRAKDAFEKNDWKLFFTSNIPFLDVEEKHFNVCFFSLDGWSNSIIGFSVNYNNDSFPAKTIKSGDASHTGDYLTELVESTI